jgi:hypothetical protein
MKLYIFSSMNWENIRIGYERQMWAVSPALDSVMSARRTRARDVRVGDRGILYTRKGPYPVLTTPFTFASEPDLYGSISGVWPEAWEMPFKIRPFGSPKRVWNAHHAAQQLPFNAERQETNLSSVFNVTGTTVFAPIEIGEEDWSMLVRRLAD